MAVDVSIDRRLLVGTLLALTCVTGLIDAASYLRLGHVFVANMTGNVVFLGFSLQPGSGLSAPASALGIAQRSQQQSRRQGGGGVLYPPGAFGEAR